MLPHYDPVSACWWLPDDPDRWPASVAFIGEVEICRDRRPAADVSLVGLAAVSGSSLNTRLRLDPAPDGPRNDLSRRPSACDPFGRAIGGENCLRAAQ